MSIKTVEPRIYPAMAASDKQVDSFELHPTAVCPQRLVGDAFLHGRGKDRFEAGPGNFHNHYHQQLEPDRHLHAHGGGVATARPYAQARAPRARPNPFFPIFNI
jgi:hypothetical protein